MTRHTSYWLIMNLFVIAIVVFAYSFGDKQLATIVFPGFHGLYWTIRAALAGHEEGFKA